MIITLRRKPKPIVLPLTYLAEKARMLACEAQSTWTRSQKPEDFYCMLAMRNAVNLIEGAMGADDPEETFLRMLGNV